MKDLGIDPTHVTAIQHLLPAPDSPAHYVPDNPLSPSPAASAFGDYSGRLADRLNECATRIADHTSEVAKFTRTVTRADDELAAGLNPQVLP